MKKLTSLAVLLTVVAMASMAFAQAEPGDLGVFFDAAGTQSTATPAAFVQTNLFYVATFDLELSGYEFSVTIGDPSIIIFATSEMTNPGGSINVGTPPNEWIVGIGLCAGGAGAVNLVQFTYGYFVASISDVLICLGPSDPASLTPAVPAWLECGTGGIFPFGIAQNGQGRYPDGCGVLWPTQEGPVANDVGSWSSLKAKF
jgi:hypothetical protein